MENYKKLVGLIEEYEKTRLWENLDGDDIFKITGFDDEIYVSICGKLGEDFSITIYKGFEELETQIDVAMGWYQGYMDSAYRLSCYKISLSDPENFLDEIEAKKLKTNRLPIKENVILRMQTGKKIRLADEKESLFLIEVMNKILRIVQVIKENRKMFDNYSFIRDMMEFDIKNNKVEFKKRDILSKKQLPLTKKVEQNIDYDKIQQVLKLKKANKYHVLFFYAPFFVKDINEYPKILVILNERTGEIKNMTTVATRDFKNISNMFLDLLIKSKINPREIFFNDNIISNLLCDVKHEIDVRTRVEVLTNEVNMIFDSMANFM